MAGYNSGPQLSQKKKKKKQKFLMIPRQQHLLRLFLRTLILKFTFAISSCKTRQALAQVSVIFRLTQSAICAFTIQASV